MFARQMLYYLSHISNPRTSHLNDILYLVSGPQPWLHFGIIWGMSKNVMLSKEKRSEREKTLKNPHPTEGETVGVI
jgi:hypothetical protein